MELKLTTLTVHKALGLRAADAHKTSDPYVKLRQFKAATTNDKDVKLTEKSDWVTIGKTKVVKKVRPRPAWRSKSSLQSGHATGVFHSGLTFFRTDFGA